jgi:hypothetical protein
LLLTSTSSRSRISRKSLLLSPRPRAQYFLVDETHVHLNPLSMRVCQRVSVRRTTAVPVHQSHQVVVFVRTLVLRQEISFGRRQGGSCSLLLTSTRSRSRISRKSLLFVPSSSRLICCWSSQQDSRFDLNPPSTRSVSALAYIVPVPITLIPSSCRGRPYLAVR